MSYTPIWRSHAYHGGKAWLVNTVEIGTNEDGSTTGNIVTSVLEWDLVSRKPGRLVLAATDMKGISMHTWACERLVKSGTMSDDITLDEGGSRHE